MLPFLALSESEADALRRSLLAAAEYLGEADAQVAGLLLERLAPHMPPGGATESISGSIHLAASVLAQSDLGTPGPALTRLARNPVIASTLWAGKPCPYIRILMRR